MRILLAEDDFATRKFMVSFLSKYGECDVTVDGMEAVDAFMMALEDDEPYDLVCLDIMMPVMDGYEATREIRKLARTDAATVPILAMTANSFDEDVANAREAGMNDHIGKPIDVAALFAALDKFLGR